MNNAPIGFLDSGIGGIPYLVSLRNALPNESFVYTADRANFPYGTRPAELVVELVHAAVERMVERFSPKLIVVACNTASVLALGSLRERFSLPFVGVVPAIKPAAEFGEHGPIGLLATDRTVRDAYVTALISSFAADREVALIPAGDLVTLIEERLTLASSAEIAAALEMPIRRLRESGVGSVVLGCTHFIHLRDRIAQLSGPACRVVDSVEGVVRQAVRVCESTGFAGEGCTSRVKVVVTGCAAPPANYTNLARIHDLEIDCDDGSGSHR